MTYEPDLDSPSSTSPFWLSRHRDLIANTITTIYVTLGAAGSLAVLAMLAALGAIGCVDTPLPDVEPQARLVATWDPLGCVGDYRVVIELEDDRGASVSRSVPCRLGGVTIDVPLWGVYRGRIYAWELVADSVAEIRSEVSVRLDIDAPLVHWYVATPR